MPFSYNEGKKKRYWVEKALENFFVHKKKTLKNQGGGTDTFGKKESFIGRFQADFPVKLNFRVDLKTFC